MVAYTSPEPDWILRRSTVDDIEPLMSWFPGQKEIEIWGGPEFRFPFTRASFLQDMQWSRLDAFSLQGPGEEFAAFGQLYERQGRTHLARLVVRPELRGLGVGKRLIGLLIIEARERYGSTEFSLFVFRGNKPAYECYKSMGFELSEYPRNMPHGDVCYFLVRRDKGGS